jgi:hypothetical protein
LLDKRTNIKNNFCMVATFYSIHLNFFLRSTNKIPVHKILQRLLYRLLGRNNIWLNLACLHVYKQRRIFFGGGELYSDRQDGVYLGCNLSCVYSVLQGECRDVIFMRIIQLPSKYSPFQHSCFITPMNDICVCVCVCVCVCPRYWQCCNMIHIMYIVSPGAAISPEKWWVWNGVQSALWVQLRSYLEQILVPPV